MDASTEAYTIRGADGIEYGPCNLEQVKEIVRQKRIKATTMVYRHSTHTWHLAASINEIRGLMRKYDPSQSSTLNRLRQFCKGDPRDSAHNNFGNISSSSKHHPFWKKLFGG
ncbi:MAG: hypothetical protein PHV34_22620 [Verrucomicrobiae bacterium]|nr:hypothetical protein [Verrucomicrobiae bacterium]